MIAKAMIFGVVGLASGIAGWATSADKPFDAVAWADSSVWDGRRTEMVDEILRSRLLIGMSRQDVTDLLGEPTPTSYFSDWDMVYPLGPERGWLSVDSEWLVLDLENGRVVAARNMRD